MLRCRFACGLAVALAALSFPLTTPPASAQTLLEETPNIRGGWVGVPWDLYVRLPQRFTTLPGDGVALDPMLTYGLVLGLPFELAVGGRYSPTSRVVVGEVGEWEAFARWRPLAQERGCGVDLAVQAGYHGVAGSADGELLLARRLGPLRVTAVGRGMSDGFGRGDPGLAAGGGLSLMPLGHRIPVALAADALWLFQPDLDDRLAWSAGLQLGLPLTPLTVSLQVANTMTATLQGATLPTDELWAGIELAFSLPTATYLGIAATREETSEAAGLPAPQAGGDVVHVDLDQYAFRPLRVVVDPGTTVVWVNQDAVVHTVTSSEGGFDSGAIGPQGSYRLTFGKSGTYPYHCAPHPFMEAVVIVR